MRTRNALFLLAVGAFALAMLAAVGVSARADNLEKPSDYGVTEAERREGGQMLLGAFVYGQRCALCHAREADGKTVYGPHLAGIVGRKAAATGWSRHTPSLKTSKVVWDEDALDALLRDPQEAMPGVQMDVAVRFKRSREALIAYLKTL